MFGFLLPQWLKTFIFNILNYVFTILGKVFGVAKPVLADVLRTFFEGCLTIVSSLLAAIDLGPLMVSVAGVWAGLDPSIAWMINATGIPQGLAMLSLAYTIRLGLNLIPATFSRI
jgi:hypothetical protein